MRDDKFPEGTPTMRDPHHGGIIQWRYWNRVFWLRHGTAKHWTAPKRAHVTPARVKVWMALLNMAGEDHE